MPKEIITESGETAMFYEESEVKDLKEQAEKAKEFTEKMESLRKELGVDDTTTVEAKLNELKEAANPNFSKYRAKFTAMEKALKDGGKEFDDDGNVITGQKPISMEEIERMTMEASNKALSQEKRNALLSTVPADNRETVNALLTKLEATGGTLEENFQLAVDKAMPGVGYDPIRNSLNASYSGGTPRIADGKPKSFSDTEEGKAILAQIIPPVKKVK